MLAEAGKHLYLRRCVVLAFCSTCDTIKGSLYATFSENFLVYRL